MSVGTWRAIPDYEGVYEVSDLGHVRSLDRKVTHRTGKVQNCAGRVLASPTGGDGRKFVSLSVGGVLHKRYVDDLVRLAFGAKDAVEVVEPTAQAISGEVVPFAFDARQVRVIIDLEGNPWFVAADVCAVLGIGDVSMAVRRLDSGDTSTAGITDSSGRRQQMLIINESGLYDLILDSRKPEARRLRRWVTSKVLPSIRKTGAYVAPTAAETPPVEEPSGLARLEALRNVVDRMIDHERAIVASQQAIARNEVAIVELRDEANSAIAGIDERVTAIESAPNWCTATAWASLRHFPQTDRATLQRLGTRAGQLARARSLEEAKVLDIHGRYPVHRWPLAVWDQAAAELGWTS